LTAFFCELIRNNIDIAIMKSIITYLILLISCYIVSGQSIKSEIKTNDTISIKILSVLPDSFPNVQLVIKANSQKGFPLWDLKKEDVRVFEQKDTCTIQQFMPITKEQPITMVIVVDHSLSMLTDAGQEISVYDYYYPERLRSKSPLHKAKKAIRSFINEFDSTKDSIGLVSFSTSISHIIPLSGNRNKIIEQLNVLTEDGSTAYFDAVYKALELLKDKEGVKYIIALTDGDDNMSAKSLNEVIAYANSCEVPIYNIGLGNVTTKPLKDMSVKTQGEFFYAKKSSDLQKVYEEVKRRISALYAITYTSANLSSNDTIRAIEIVFDVDNAVSKSEAYSFYLPASVRVKLQEIEAAKANQEIFVYAGIGAAAVITISGLLIVYRRRKKKMETYV